jgi:hypothetical protein
VSDVPDVPPALLAQLRPVCLGFPESIEEAAWTGTRWRVRAKTFAHVLVIDAGWPPAYARAAGTHGPATVLMFRAAGPDLDALRRGGAPFFAPPWRGDEVGVVLPADAAAVDWDEITELLTESYCVQAPRSLAARVDRPEG